MEIRVCDMIMGAGKTESAITMINEDTESRYIFITPYLNEVDRIVERCACRNFYAPENKSEGGKFENLHVLLREKRNIASTHSLFDMCNEHTAELIRDGGYKLILDEAFGAIKIRCLKRDDVKNLKQNYVDTDDDGYIHWRDDTYDGVYNDVKDMCNKGFSVIHNDSVMLIGYPREIFEAFAEITVLTYLFDAQINKYYFDLLGAKIKKIGTTCENGVYRFTDDPKMPEYVSELARKIHIVEGKGVNAIGEHRTSLSSTWYLKGKTISGDTRLKKMKNNLLNVYKNKFGSPSAKNLWTTFKDYRSDLCGVGYSKNFLPYNTRATNDYRDRDHLAYCVNVFYNPFLKSYMSSMGIKVDENLYALSEMIQWIWRSAIRDGHDIWVYVPSKRMRTLLKCWISSLSREDIVPISAEEYKRGMEAPPPGKRHIRKKQEKPTTKKTKPERRKADIYCGVAATETQLTADG